MRMRGFLTGMAALAIGVCGRPGALQAQLDRFLPCSVAAGAKPSAIVSGDLNRDGTPDAVVLRATEARVTVLLANEARFALGDCAGAVSTREVDLSPVLRGETIPSGGGAVAVGDVDQNGTLDSVVASRAGILVLRGDGEGGLVLDATSLAAGVDPRAVAVGDVDGDGRSDIVAGNGDGNSVTILFGKSTGGFEAALTIPLNGPITSVAAADLNKDSFGDIVAVSSGLGELIALLQVPAVPRSFQVLTPLAVGLTKPVGLGVGDFDGNGGPDVAVVGGGANGKLNILLNQLPGNPGVPFSLSVSQDTRGSTSALAVGLLNSDGSLDVAVANQDVSEVRFFVGDGRGKLMAADGNCVGQAERDACDVGAEPSGIALGDVDGDGRADVMTSNQAGASVSFLLSSLPATPTPSPTPTATVPGLPSPTSSVTPTRTPTPGGDCCVAHDGPGCAPAECQKCVADLRPACVQTAWDQRCAELAYGSEDSGCTATCACPTVTPTGPTATLTSTPTATHTPTETIAPSATPSPTVTLTPRESYTPTHTSTATPSVSGTPTETLVPRPTGTVTPTGSPTQTPSRTPSKVPTTVYERCLGETGLCVEGKGCSLILAGQDRGIAWLGIPALLLLVRRRRR